MRTLRMCIVLGAVFLACPILGDALQPPPIPLQDDVPLYGPSGQPEENDVHQEGTPDCFLESSVAAIVRTDLKTITGMIGTPLNNQVTVTMYGSDGKEDKLQVELKNLNDRYSANDSRSS